MSQTCTKNIFSNYAFYAMTKKCALHFMIREFRIDFLLLILVYKIIKILLFISLLMIG